MKVTLQFRLIAMALAAFPFDADDHHDPDDNPAPADDPPAD
jgi:hypothetical protein